MNKVITMTPDYMSCLDQAEIKIINEKFHAGPTRTRIRITDHNSGKLLHDNGNKIVITGSMYTAMNTFGINTPVILPNYNTEMNLDNTLDYTQVQPKNNPIVCLFCVGDSGCGSSPKDVFTAKYIDRINPVNDILPFRYVDIDDDLNSDLRHYYFGRKTLPEKNRIAYYFKSFDTTPQLHLRYTDATQITDELYQVNTSQPAEVYVETRLRITRLDFREYFEQVRGWDLARVSTISLCYAWFDNEIDDYAWYQQIYPYSKLNFSYEHLVDLTKAIDINYMVFY